VATSASPDPCNNTVHHHHHHIIIIIIITMAALIDLSCRKNHAHNEEMRVWLHMMIA
jgi:hypothetical protein